MLARSLAILVPLSLSLPLAGCPEDDCPAGTRPVAGRCVAGVPVDHDGGGDGDADADGDGDGDGDADADLDGDSDGDADAGGVVLDDGGGDGGCDVRAVYRDADGDGWGGAETREACSAEAGWVDRPGDCDDAVDTTHPEATELCNAVDDDCANGPDDVFVCVQGAAQTCTTSCGTTGSTTCGLACTLDACTPPAEVCNYVDDDCDGLVDPDQQVFLGDAVRMTAAQGTNVWQPRIAWGGQSYAVGWANGANIVVTTRDGSLGALEAPANVVTDNANVAAVDLAYSGSVWVAGHDAGGGGGARRYELTELDEGLEVVDDWQSNVGNALSVVAVDTAPVAGGVVALFQTSTPEIRARGITSGAAALHNGATLDGLTPDAAPSVNGDVLVAYQTDGELGVALLDEDGDESIGQRVVTDIGTVGRVAVAQARTDATVVVFETSNGAGPVRTIVLDDGLAAQADPLEIADEGEIAQDALAASDTELLATYEVGSDAWLVRLDLAGDVSGAAVELPRILGQGNSPGAKVVWADDAWAIVYIDDADDNPSSGWDVYARRYGCP